MPNALEILVIVVAIMALFGRNKIPEILRNLTQARDAFEKGQEEGPPAEESEERRDRDTSA